jgi:hypothetical protein
MLLILAFMEPYSAALNKAVLIVKLVYMPAGVVVGEYRLGFKSEVTFIM